MISSDKVFSGWAMLPKGRAGTTIIPGCLILEGGAFRGVYTSGVLDALMQEGILFQTVVGVSAGGLNGMNYLSGQIGRSARVNLRYRHDPRLVSSRNLLKGGIIGFDFMLKDVQEEEPFDEARFLDPATDYYVVATDVNTGLPRYFSKKEEGIDIYQAAQASASMPYVSRPVMIQDTPYLDGGCSAKIPLDFALEKGFENIVVIRTRPAGFRKGDDSDFQANVNSTIYRNNPEFAQALSNSNKEYDRVNQEIDRLSRRGRIFSISPSRNVEISRLEGDMEKLGELYYMGYHDGRRAIPALRKYLRNGENELVQKVHDHQEDGHGQKDAGQTLGQLPDDGQQQHENDQPQ